MRRPQTFRPHLLHNRHLLLLLLIYLLISQLAHAFVDFYISAEENLKIIGINTDLYYIQRGKLNEYALGFTVPVHTRMQKLHFVWESLTQNPVPYWVDIGSTNFEVIDPPALNITRFGMIPTHKQVFFITLSCNRSHSGPMNEANVHITFRIGLSHLSNLTMTLKRKKICMRNDMPPPLQLPPNSIAADSPQLAVAQPAAPSQSLPSHLEKFYTPLYIFIVFTTCFTVCAAFLSLLCYMRMQKSQRDNQYLNYSGISTQLAGKSTGQLLAQMQRGPHISLQLSNDQDSVLSTPKLTHQYLRHQPPPSHPPPQIPSQQSSSNKSGSNSNTSSRPTTYSTGTQSVHSDRTGYQSVDPFDPQCMFQPLPSSRPPRADSLEEINHDCSTRPVSRHSPNYCLPKKPLSPYSSHTSLFDLDQVRLHSLQCEGQFGKIYNGVYRDLVNCEERDVVVKTLIADVSKMIQSSFVREGLLLQGLRHPHLLSCTLVAKDNRQPLLLYPQVQQRNLKHVLLQRRNQSGQLVQPLQPALLIRLALQLADALAYVHENCLLHKDVAVRNCVISGLELLNTNANSNGNNMSRQGRISLSSINQPGQILRLADTALARDLFPEDYCALSGCGSVSRNNEQLPIRWMPYECLLGKKNTTQSDVWAFGVAIWEMLTLAEMPYEAVKPEEIPKLLWDGYRLRQPPNCPDTLFSIMTNCWELDPKLRDDFPKLFVKLREFYIEINKFV